MSIKTPITILQELCVKAGSIPHFEFLDQGNAFFQFKVRALDLEAIGDGRCKKDAKQEAARMVLKKLAEAGKYFPTDCDNLTVPNATPEAQDVLLNSVSSLTDFCSTYHIPPPEFILLSETGPPHSKRFTMQCIVGSIERVATALSKKQAKHSAASIVLEYFKNNMDEKVLEFEKQEYGKSEQFEAEKKFLELSEEPWRPNLGFIISNYHYGLNEIEKDLLNEARNYMSSLSIDNGPQESNIDEIVNLLDILKLEYKWESVESVSGSSIIILKVPHAIPPVFVDGTAQSPESAKIKSAHKALIFFKQMLRISKEQ